MAPLLQVPDAALEQARMQLERARWAVAGFSRLDRAATACIAQDVAEAAHACARPYAEREVRDTGIGVVADKCQLNEACSTGLLARYGAEDFVTPRVDLGHKIVDLPRPLGVILAVLPRTCPVAALYAHSLMALMTRNAVILSPPLGAVEVCVDAARRLAKAAAEAGAPDGVIQVIGQATDTLLESLMADARIDLVIADGPATAQAATRAGRMVYGAGPGNAPVLVDDTADLSHAARRIVASKAFDNGALDTGESVLLAYDGVADALLTALRHEGAHVCTPDETAALRHLMFTPQGLNPALIGRDASVIAQLAGFSAPGARILIASVGLVQPEEPLVGEKLCPVLAFARVAGLAQAISSARSMMRTAGQGHSAAIHSRDGTTILAFASALPALRVVVNAGCTLGASGFETHLGPSMTICTGLGLSENLTPQHLVRQARIAVNADPDEPFTLH